MSERRSLVARREFLKFVAASPYVAAARGLGAFLRLPGAAAQNAGAPATDLIAGAAAALNVFDLEEGAHRKVSQAHWAYIASGVGGHGALRANRAHFQRVPLR